MWYMNEFHSNGVIPKGYNSSFITLIPKLEDPQNLGEFRPISLVGCMYKILTKVLARKVKKVLHNVIDGKQSAFLEERNILQSLLVENETMDEVKRFKKKGFIFQNGF